MKRLFVPAAVLFIVAGCATTGEYYGRLGALVRESRYSEAGVYADASFEKSYGGKNELLYLLDRGFLSHLAGDYVASNEILEKAHNRSRELFTRSISAEAATFLVSDNVRAYYGEDFERVFIHIFKALNYIFEGDNSAALVETRRADHLLRTLETHYDGRAAYREDAFARYLAGLIEESAGEINAAHVSYMRALDAYRDYLKNYGTPPPSAAAADAARTASLLGMKSRAADLSEKYALAAGDTSPPPAGSGEIVALIYAGVSPVKIDSFFEISFGRAWIHAGSVEAVGEEESQVEQARRLARSIAAEEQVVMAFPKYQPSPYRATAFAMRVSTSPAAESEAVSAEVVQDVGAIASAVLDERIGRIRVKTIARSAVKYALSKKIGAEVGKAGGDKALGWLTQKILSGAAAATELADKRSWRTLPDKIFIARDFAPEGFCDVTIDFYDSGGNKVASRRLENTEVKKGRRTFVAVRSAI